MPFETFKACVMASMVSAMKADRDAEGAVCPQKHRARSDSIARHVGGAGSLTTTSWGEE